MAYSECRDFEIGLMLQQDPRAAEASREAEQEAAAADWLAFQNWAEDRKIPPECWDAWLDNGHIHPEYRPDLETCIYCGATDVYDCICDHRDDELSDWTQDHEIPF